MSGPPSPLIVRAPNHLGDVVAALPAIAESGGDVMVVRWLLPLLELAGLPGRLLPLDRGPRGFADAVKRLRGAGYERGILLTPAFSAAWLFKVGKVGALRGTDSDGRRWLLRERVDRDALRGVHRFQQYRIIAGLEGAAEARPHPLRLSPDLVERWRGRVPAGETPLVGVFPGSNAPARRWPAGRFLSMTRGLAGEGLRVVVLGSTAERELTRGVGDTHPNTLDLGGKTSLPDLAAVLSLCDVLVTNDSGPMHLAAALGTPTVTVWGPSDPKEATPVGAPSVAVTGPPLPCKPCRENRCPRSGPGTILDDAHEECMRLIETDDVIAAVWGCLGGRPA